MATDASFNITNKHLQRFDDEFGVTTRYDLDAREEAARKTQELVKQIPISTDRSGLP